MIFREIFTFLLYLDCFHDIWNHLKNYPNAFLNERNDAQTFHHLWENAVRRKFLSN